MQAIYQVRLLAFLVSLLCCSHVGAQRASIPVLLPYLSPVTFRYEHGSSLHAFFRTNPGAELAHWREGQRECANSAQFQMTVNFVSMAHSSDDDGDYSLPSEDEDANYVDYVKISMPGRQSFSIPCTVPDGGDAQGHGHSTNRKQTRTRRASAEQQKAASGSYSHAGGDGDHEAYDENNACLLNLRISQCDMWCDLQNKRLWCILFHLLPLPLPLICSSISACFALHF
jgi:hypothetical protein